MLEGNKEGQRKSNMEMGRKKGGSLLPIIISEISSIPAPVVDRMVCHIHAISRDPQLVTQQLTDLPSQLILNQEKNFYMRSVNDTRWIQTGYGKNKKLYCKGIAFLPEDVDAASFVSVGNAEDVQAILSFLEPEMPVTLWPNEDCNRFDIYFDGQLIGYTSREFTTALFAGFDATNHNKNWPSSIQDVYITAITTVIMPEKTDIDPQYKKSGCWLGIELGGFPTIEWY